MQFHMMTLFDVLGKIYRGYLLFGGEYQIHFIECVENFDVFNSRDEIYLVFTKKKKKKKKKLFILYFFRRFRSTVNQFVNHASRQRSICDRIPGPIYMIYSHQDLQIKINSFSVKMQNK